MQPKPMPMKKGTAVNNPFGPPPEEKKEDSKLEDVQLDNQG